MKKCGRCGMEVPDSATICPYCKSDVSSLSQLGAQLLAALLTPIIGYFIIWLLM